MTTNRLAKSETRTITVETALKFARWASEKGDTEKSAAWAKYASELGGGTVGVDWKMRAAGDQ